MTEHINTEGIVSVGEITTRVQREAIEEANYHNAYVAGAVTALQNTESWCREQIKMAGPYDDVRHLEYLTIWLTDRIREVQPEVRDAPTS
jgi:hypothetical protein